MTWNKLIMGELKGGGIFGYTETIRKDWSSPLKRILIFTKADVIFLPLTQFTTIENKEEFKEIKEKYVVVYTDFKSAYDFSGIIKQKLFGFDDLEEAKRTIEKLKLLESL